MNADTAARILSVARELGYLEEESVQRVKFVTFLKEGLIADAPYFPPIIAAAEKECRSQGMEMVLHNINKRSAVYEEEIEQLREDKKFGCNLTWNRNDSGGYGCYPGNYNSSCGD